MVEKTEAQLAAMQRNLQRKIEKLCAIEYGLTEWEMDFIDDVAKQFERDGYLSDGQWAKVDQIIAKRT